MLVLWTAIEPSEAAHHTGRGVLCAAAAVVVEVVGREGATARRPRHSRGCAVRVRSDAAMTLRTRSTQTPSKPKIRENTQEIQFWKNKMSPRLELSVLSFLGDIRHALAKLPEAGEAGRILRASVSHKGDSPL